MSGRTPLTERVLDATFDEVSEHGLAGLTVEAVALRAGSSRATVYRHFPGGRDELVARTIRREVTRFVEEVLSAAPSADPPEGDVVGHVAGLVHAAHHLLGEHDVLQRLLVDEADAIVPSLATVLPLIGDALSEHLVGVLELAARRGELVSGVDVGGAADHASRLLLSYVGSAGRWDLEDRREAERLVRTRVLVGVLGPGA